MSGLWTPHGEHEHEPGREQPEGGGARPPAAGPEEEAARQQLAQLREQLAATPVVDVLANHVIGLWELAVLHLTPEEGHGPDLAEAGLAIDAVAALVEGLGDRLGRHHQPLQDALAQLRLAFVEVSQRAGGNDTSG